VLNFVQNKVLFVYTAYSNKICCYDLRRPEIILKETYISYTNNEDEINQICIDEEGKYLASCDDSAQIKLFNLEQKQLYKNLRNKKQNTIYSSVQFRPGISAEENVFSGGLDSQILIWDTSRSKVIFSINCVEEVSITQITNPPHVHSICFNKDGSKLAAALGDYSVLIYDIPTRNKLRLFDINAHTNSVAQVIFTSFAPNLLLSGGNDSKIILWDIADNKTLNKKNKQTVITPISRIKMKIAHTSKINWLTTISSAIDNVFVADQSNVISIYTVS